MYIYSYRYSYIYIAIIYIVIFIHKHRWTLSSKRVNHFRIFQLRLVLTAPAARIIQVTLAAGVALHQGPDVGLHRVPKTAVWSDR